MSNELKPCPFCGGDNKHRDDCYITMIIEYAEHKQFLEQDDEKKLEKAWNTRVEKTCEMPMVFEDDEGNELDSSAAYFRYYRCSNCGEIMEHYKHEHWSYCPNCGAKVVEVV